MKDLKCFNELQTLLCAELNKKENEGKQYNQFYEDLMFAFYKETGSINVVERDIYEFLSDRKMFKATNSVLDVSKVRDSELLEWLRARN